MDKTCGVITGLLVMAIGASKLGFLGALAAYEGWLFMLIGLAVLVHSLKMCPMCKA
jgi:hypothetical protein